MRLIPFFAVLCLVSASTYAQTAIKPGGVALVHLQISKPDNNFLVSLSDKKLVADSDKKMTNPTTWNPGDCVCFLQDENNKVIDTLVIEQPLKQRYEYPNDDGSIGSTVVDLTTNNVLVRFNYNDAIKSMRVATVKPNGRLKNIDTFQLNF